MKSKYFELGQTFCTYGINNAMKDNDLLRQQVFRSLERHCRKDWGELDEEDKALNDEAVENGDDRIFSAYETCEGRVWIITEADRSATTILFPSEY